MLRDMNDNAKINSGSWKRSLSLLSHVEILRQNALFAYQFPGKDADELIKKKLS